MRVLVCAHANRLQMANANLHVYHLPLANMMCSMEVFMSTLVRTNENRRNERI